MFERVETGRRRRRHTLLLLPAVALVLAACGGGDGGGGGGGPATAAKLHALIVNAAETDAAVTYTDASGTPTDETVATCSAKVLDLPLTDPFTLAVDGSTIIDSNELAAGLPNGGTSDLVVQVKIARDGTASFDSVRPGRSVTPPARSAYCPTLPG